MGAIEQSLNGLFTRVDCIPKAILDGAVKGASEPVAEATMNGEEAELMMEKRGVQM